MLRFYWIPAPAETTKWRIYMLPQAFGKAIRNLTLPGIMKLFVVCLVAYGIGWVVMAWLIGSLVVALAGASGAEGMFLHMLGAIGGWWLAWFFFPLLYPI